MDHACQRSVCFVLALVIINGVWITNLQRIFTSEIFIEWPIGTASENALEMKKERERKRLFE